LLWAPLPRGQAGAQQRDSTEARELFEQAAEALQVGRFTEAVDLLRRSLELEPRPSTAFNLAVALRGMGDLLAAERMFEQLVDGQYGSVEPRKRKEVRSMLGEVRAEIAELSVRIRGSESAAVRLDGEGVATVRRGEALEVRVNPGRHQLEARARGREPVERAIELSPGSSERVTLELPPDRRPGVLALRSEEPGARLEIVGVAQGETRLERELAPGDYTVRVTGEDGTHETNVRVPPAERVGLKLDPPTRGFFERPLVWVGIGIVVAGAAAAAIAVPLTRNKDPVVDDFWGNTKALRW
jgi:hypothetical protein